MPTSRKVATPGSGNLTTIFVSHVTEERELALPLKEMLEELFSGDVEVFVSSDTDSILSGEKWTESVRNALNRASILIVLCSKTSLQRAWVQFEVGAAWMRDIPIIPICHSGTKLTDLPIPLSLQNALEISQPGMERLFNSVARALNTNRKARPSVIAKHLKVLKQAQANFTPASVVQFERHFDVVIPSPGTLEGEDIPDDAVVESNADSLRLFGYLTPGPMTWKDIERAARRVKDQRWLRELEKCICDASQNRDFRPVQAIYHCGEGSYQPQLAKREILSNGASKYHVHLVETVVAPLTEVQNEFGLMATVLRLGLRFRYEVIQKYHYPVADAVKRKKDAGPHVQELRKQICASIEVIENDALSRGAENIQPAAIAELFALDEDQEEISRIQDDWEATRAALFDDKTPPDAAAMRNILQKMRELNYRFMDLGTRRFHEMVTERWNGAPPHRHATPSTPPSAGPVPPELIARAPDAGRHAPKS
jgi:hypothetical protein